MEGIVWAEPVATSKAFQSLCYHIKKKACTEGWQGRHAICMPRRTLVGAKGLGTRIGHDSSGHMCQRCSLLLPHSSQFYQLIVLLLVIA